MEHALTITINLPDGTEIHDIPATAPSAAAIPTAVQQVLRDKFGPTVDDEKPVYSSLVIVAVPVPF